MFVNKHIMKPVRIRFRLMVVMTVMILAGACKPGHKESGVLIQDVDQPESSAGIESFNQIYHLYPSPGEMLSVIDISDMSYDAPLLNPTARADEYLDSKSKSQVLGVYMTDLAYSALFGRHEETLDYLETVKSLSDEINITEALDESMIEKARENVKFLDSLYNISNDAFINILHFCEKNERSNTLVYISAGAFIESLYLAVYMIDDYATASLLLQHLADQKYTMNNFMQFARSVGKDDPGVDATLEDMEDIKDIYDRIETGAGEVTVKATSTSDANEPKKLVFGSSASTSQPRLTEEEFNALKIAVTKLRNNTVRVK
jgi:hypothetical protein